MYNNKKITIIIKHLAMYIHRHYTHSKALMFVVFKIRFIFFPEIIIILSMNKIFQVFIVTSRCRVSSLV